MGLFDYVHVTGPAFVCSEGHALAGEEFQSKDFGCTMGHVAIGSVGSAVMMDDGGYGAAMVPGLTDYIEVYGDCTQCPAFVQTGTGNLVPVWCNFKVHVVKDVVQSIERTSPTTAEFLESTPKQPYMVGCFGPMPHSETWVLRKKIWGTDPDVR